MFAINNNLIRRIMGISISKSPNWVPGKGLVFSNQRGGVGGMNMGGNSSGGGAGGGSGGGGVVTPSDIYTKMLLHFDDAAKNSDVTITSVYAPMRGTLNPDGTKAYVGTWGSTPASNGVHVIDVATNTKLTTISSPYTGTGLVTNSTGTRLYVANYGTANSNAGGSTVTIIDTVNNVVLGTVSVGANAQSVDITPNDKFLFVACQNNGLYRIDLTAGTLSSTNVGSGSYGPAVSPDGTKITVAGDSQVYVYSLNQSTGAVSLTSTLTGFSAPYGVIKSSTTAYYPNWNAGTVIPVDFATGLKGTAITVGTSPYGGMVSPDGKKLYVANTGGNSVSVINTASNTVIQTLTGFTSPRGCVATNEKLMVFNNTASSVSVIDVRNLTDAALSPLTQYRVGTVETSATQSKFGGKSLYLNGTNTNKLQFANPKAKAMDFSNQPFCIEAWFYLTAYNTSGRHAGLITYANADNGDNQGIHIDLNNSNRFEVFMSTNGTSWDLGAPTIGTSVSPTLNTWFHLALIRETAGGDIKLVHNGSVIGTKTTTASLYTGDYMYVGKSNYWNSTDINGYVDDVRVVVGSCPYSAAAFVVPTAELTAVTNTKLLLKGNGAVISDDSSNNLYTSSKGGAQTSTAQSKFGGSSIKISSATGDFVKIYNNTQPIALLDRPFTIEGWFYKIGTGFQQIMGFANADGQGPNIAIQADGTISAAMSTSGVGWTNSIGSSTVPSSNAWHHFALTRDITGGAIKFYLDGSLIGSTTPSSPLFTAETFWIGHYPYYYATNPYTFNGYIDEVRVIVGKNPYSGEFTPASTAYTDGYNMLLHFDGANGSTTVTDSSTSPKTMTAYGGATISTTKSKFGGSSMYFPGVSGTGCRVTANNSSDFAFGTGDFTVEMNLNLSSLGTGHIGTMFGMVFDTRTSITQGPGLFMYFDSNRKLKIWAQGTTFATSNTTIEIGNWYHVALTRKSSKFYLYINGVLDATADLATNFTESSMSIGAPFDYSGAPGFLFNGYIDEFRVCKGTALYAGTATTVPTSEFSLLTT
jgi:YVTN family beta-propeller protein